MQSLTQVCVLCKKLLLFRSKEVHVHPYLYVLLGKGHVLSTFVIVHLKELEKGKCTCCTPPWLEQHIFKAIFVKDVSADFDVFFLLLLHCLKILFIPFHLEK